MHTAPDGTSMFLADAIDCSLSMVMYRSSSLSPSVLVESLCQNPEAGRGPVDVGRKNQEPVKFECKTFGIR